MIRAGIKKFGLATGLLFFIALPAYALESKAVISPRATVTLVSDTDAVEPGKNFRLGLRFRQTKGWHIYWLNPGDAGQPPAIEQILLPGGKYSDFDWPTPIRIVEGPEMVFAYQNEITLPFTVSPPATLKGDTFTVDATANWLICAKSCIPERGSFHLSLPVGPPKPSLETSLFAASAARTPRYSPFPSKFTDKALIFFADKSLTPKTLQDAWFFPATWGTVEHAAPQTLSFDDNGIELALKPGPTFNPKVNLAGVLVLKDFGGKESSYTISSTPDKSPDPAKDNLFQMLLFALLGGLILNLMPCVFPILAMKALSIAKLSGAARHHVRGQAVFYTLGVLAAFTVIDLLLLVLRSAGKAAGWGFQFQSPVFVTAMAWLLFGLGLNLSGVYTISGGALIGIGESYAGRKGALGSFCTGLLAVIVATPCVAPFVGAAIAAALAASPLGMLAIFFALGLGLALPYVALAVFPDAVRFLPRPGRWMELLRQFFAFPLYGASAWLLWVLTQQNGSDGLAVALSGGLLLAIVAWLHGQVHPTHVFARRLRYFFTLFSLVLAGFLLVHSSNLAPSPNHASVSFNGFEEPYSAKRLAELRAEGKPVFVNMTAAWCITCLVNERVAILADTVKDAFIRNDVVYLKGDWTQQDPAISIFLRENGSEGVPLYVFFPANGRAPVLLPQILTASTILNTLNNYLN